MHHGFPTPLLRQVFDEQQAFAGTGERVPLHSNISLEEAVQLYELAGKQAPAHSLEVGFAQGISTLAILQALQDNGAGQHHVLDPFQERFHNVGLAMVARAGLTERLDFQAKFAEEVIPSLPPLQFAFIDSSHLFDLTLTEFVLVDKKLAVGGLVAFHDLWMPSLRKLARYVLNNRSYALVPTGANGSPSWKQNLRRTLARVLRAVPGSEGIFQEELLRPWFTLAQGNLLVLRKTGEDQREWQFHRRF